MKRIFLSACLVCALLGYTANAAGQGNQSQRSNTNYSKQAGSAAGSQDYNHQYNQGTSNKQQANYQQDNSDINIRGRVVNIDNVVSSGRFGNTSRPAMNSSQNNGYKGTENSNSTTGSNNTVRNNSNNSYSDNNYNYYPPQPGVIGRAPGNNSPDINRAYQRETNVDLMRSYHRTYGAPVREGNTINSGFDVRIPDNVVSPDASLRATRFYGTSTSEQARIENGKRIIAQRTGRPIPSPYAASYNDRIGVNDNMAYNGLNASNESRYATLAPEVDNSARNANSQGSNSSINRQASDQAGNANMAQPRAAGIDNNADNRNMNSANNSNSVLPRQATAAPAPVKRDNTTVAAGSDQKTTVKSVKSKSKSSAMKSANKTSKHKSAKAKKSASYGSASRKQTSTGRMATLRPEQPNTSSTAATIRHDYGLMVGSGDNARVYLVYDKNGRIANDKLKNYANKEITVRGSVKNVNGLNVIYLDQVIPANY